jgi:hypothetical protein
MLTDVQTEVQVNKFLRGVDVWERRFGVPPWHHLSIGERSLVMFSGHAVCCSKHYPIYFTMSTTKTSYAQPTHSKDILVVSKNIIADIVGFHPNIAMRIFNGTFISFLNKIATHFEHYTHLDILPKSFVNGEMAI